FCTDYFEALFDAAAGYPDLEQYISTNGLLVDERWARKLVSSRGGLCYSIDGLRRATYENIRKGGRFDDLIRSVERIKNHQAGKKSKNFEFSLNFVVMRSNYREVPEILDFARKYGFQAVQLFPIQGNYAENMFLKPAPGEMNFLREAVCGLKDKSKLYNIHLHSCIPISGGNNAGRVSRKKGGSAAEKKNMFCYHPWQSLFIDNLGTVFPHCFCVKPVGNADKNTLDEIWNNAGMRSCRRKMAGGAIDGFCNPLCLSGALKEQDLRGFLR
ncbi:MAG TPA: radical SAM protein, partial [bacterium]|nr:radical SAM protein [bacterium]